MEVLGKLAEKQKCDQLCSEKRSKFLQESLRYLE
jgi:hypothetical protein